MKENRISELRKNVTAEKFRIAYSAFMEQADKNSVSRKGQGSRTPFGFEGNREFDGANLSQHFGQGAASSTPYINWWVVSIYYLPDTGKIIMGIEEDRYPYLGKMNPDRYTYIGNKATRVAVFYSASKKDAVSACTFNTLNIIVHNSVIKKIFLFIIIPPFFLMVLILTFLFL